MENMETKIKDLSKKEHLSEQEKSFVKQYYRSLFLGQIAQISNIEVTETGDKKGVCKKERLL